MHSSCSWQGKLSPTGWKAGTPHNSAALTVPEKPFMCLSKTCLTAKRSTRLPVLYSYLPQCGGVPERSPRYLKGETEVRGSVGAPGRKERGQGRGRWVNTESQMAEELLLQERVRYLLAQLLGNGFTSPLKPTVKIKRSGRHISCFDGKISMHRFFNPRSL